RMARPMVDRLCKDLPRLIQAASSVEHAIDFATVFGPLLHLVVVECIRDKRTIGRFVGPIERFAVFAAARQVTPPPSLLATSAVIGVAVLAGVTKMPMARIAGMAFASFGCHQPFTTVRKALELDGSERVGRRQYGTNAH